MSTNVRGPEVSRSPQTILEEVRRLADAGVTQVTLLGQTVNSYRFDADGRRVGLADLRVHAERLRAAATSAQLTAARRDAQQFEADQAAAVAEGEHEVVVHFSGVRWTMYVDGELLDNDFPFGYPQWVD